MRYTTEGPSEKLGGAMLPVPAKMGQAFQSWGAVVGFSGNERIPAPYPAAVPQGQVVGALGSTDATSTSKDAPPYWTPGVYYQPKLASRFHGAINSDNQMPLPAVQPSGATGFVAGGNSIAAFMARRGLSGRRQKQVGQPLVTPQYPWR